MKPVLLTVSELAFHFGQSRDSVRKRLAQAHVSPAKSEGRRQVYALRDAIPALTGADASPFDAKARAQTRLLEMQAAERAGRLLRYEDVECEFARAMKAVAHMLDLLPDILERDHGLTPQQIEAIEKQLDQLREQLFLRITAPRDEAKKS